jgi:hypothetical protein
MGRVPVRMAAGLFVLAWRIKHMSKKTNVHPGQYKVAGRERLGEPLGQERDKQQLAKTRDRREPKAKASKKR